MARIDATHFWATSLNKYDPPTLGLRVLVKPIHGVTPSHVFGDVRRLVFPAVMNSLEVSEEATFSDYDSVGAGSFSIRRAGDDTARELRSFNLDVYATDIRNLAFTQNDAPATWVTTRDLIRKIFRARFPVHLEARVIKRADYIGAEPLNRGGAMYLFQGVEEVHDFKGQVTFRSFTHRLEHGQPESRYFTIGVKDNRAVEEVEEHVKYHRKGATNLPVTRTVRDGDTLWSLAEVYYGQGSLYRLIQKQNAQLRKIPASSPLKNHKIKSVRIPKPPSGN